MGIFEKFYVQFMMQTFGNLEAIVKKALCEINLCVIYDGYYLFVIGQKMGGCVPAQSKVQKPGKQNTAQPATSTLQVRESTVSNIFNRMSSPVENLKIVKKCEQLSSLFESANIDMYKKYDWKKLDQRDGEGKNLYGICKWASENQNILNGPSILYFSDKGSQYLVAGVFLDGKIKQKEKCLKIFESGTYYSGHVNSELVPNGYGQLYVNQHEYYKGYFNCGVPHGQGEKFSNGKQFVGMFKRGEIIKGKQITKKGSYEGPFKNNTKHGKGLLRMNSGLSYEGEFQNNKKSGEGVLYDKDQNIIFQGKWKEDRQVK